MHRILPGGRESRFCAWFCVVALLLPGVSCTKHHHHRAKATPSASLVSIEVTPANASTPAGTTRQYRATGSFNDGSQQDLTLSVEWSSSEPSVASIQTGGQEIGLVSTLTVGTTTITAKQGDLSASTQLTVTEPKVVSIEVTPSQVTLPVLAFQSFTAEGTLDNGQKQDVTDTATWSSSNAVVASVGDQPGSKGRASALTLGECDIIAALSGVQGQAHLIVREAAILSIVLSPVDPTIPRDSDLDFTATGVFDNQVTRDVTEDASWSSSDVQVATVSNAAGSRGRARGHTNGSSVITASLGGAQGSTTLTVREPVMVSLSVTPTNPSIVEGTTIQFAATGVFDNNTTQDLTAQASWTSSEAAIATVGDAAGSKGLASGLLPGTSRIRAAHGALSGDTLLTVTVAKLVSISLDPPNPSRAAGSTVQFTATGLFDNSTTQDLTTQAAWASATANVATVSDAAPNKGLATAVSVGSSEISATKDGVKGTTTLTVTTAKLVSISVTPVNPSLVVKTTLQFTATGVYENSTSQDLTTQVTWSSSAGAMLEVSDQAGTKGKANAVAVGQADVTARLGDVSGSTHATVIDTTLTSITVTPTDPSIQLGLDLGFTATGHWDNALTQDMTQDVVWTSSAEAVATVSNAAGSKGLAHGVALGQTTISAAMGQVKGSTTLTVIESPLVSIRVTPENPMILTGTEQAFTATGTYGNNSTQDLTQTVTWGTSNAAIATISNAAGTRGKATAVAKGSSTITATLGDKSGSTGLSVLQAKLTSIMVEPPNPSVSTGQEQAFKATGTYENSMTQDLTASVLWSSSDLRVAAISNANGTKGKATALADGWSTIAASMEGVTGSTRLNVGVSNSPFVRCDCNQDSKQDIADSVQIVMVLFMGAPPKPCLSAMDCNDDGVLTVPDALYGIRYQFQGGPRPAAPFPECGSDTTEDSLTCEAFPRCR